MNNLDYYKGLLESKDEKDDENTKDKSIYIDKDKKYDSDEEKKKDEKTKKSKKTEKDDEDDEDLDLEKEDDKSINEESYSEFKVSQGVFKFPLYDYINMDSVHDPSKVISDVKGKLLKNWNILKGEITSSKYSNSDIKSKVDKVDKAIESIVSSKQTDVEVSRKFGDLLFRLSNLGFTEVDGKILFSLGKK